MLEAEKQYYYELFEYMSHLVLLLCNGCVFYVWLRYWRNELLKTAIELPTKCTVLWQKSRKENT